MQAKQPWTTGAALSVPARSLSIFWAAIVSLGLALVCSFAGTLQAQTPPSDPAQLVRGNPEAPVGGLFRDRFSVPPSQLHPLNATDLYANQVLDRIYEQLTEVDVETLEFIPLLAKSWEVGADKKTYTFHLDPRARWQDGRPLTAEDVAFSFQVMFHEKLRTRGKWQAYYSNFERVEVIDTHTVRFFAKIDHFRNFVNIGSLRVLPKQGFPDEDPNKTPLSKVPMGSGSYRFDRWERASAVRLQRHDGYWGWDLPQNRGRNNYQLWMTKIIQTDKVALESLKKGELDLMTFTPEQWTLETNGSDFAEAPGRPGRIVKLDVQNKSPRSYRYVGWNLEHAIFSDKRVRWAMSHLFDRETIIEKFYYGLDETAVGPFAANSRYASPKVVPVSYSVREALRLLREAGWSDSDGDRVLDKDGRPLRFTIMTADPETSVKVLTLTKENMRRAGVDLRIQVVDWSTLLELIDEYRFEAVMLGWNRTSWPDPTALWHSDSAVKGGLNLVRYKNPEVDRLIEAGVKSIPESERIDLYQRIHEMIFADQPYTFLVERSHQLMGYTARLGTVKPWYAYEVGQNYWWVQQPSR